jgi:hypothetical protein
VSYLEELRSKADKLDPLGELVRERTASAHRALSDPVRVALAQLTANADAMGVFRLSTREVYLKLGIPEALKLSASKRVAEAMRSLGWTHCRLSRRPGVGRAWGWMKINYNIPAPAGSMERDEAELLCDKATNKRTRERANENEELHAQFASLVKASVQKSDLPRPVSPLGSSRYT